MSLVFRLSPTCFVAKEYADFLKCNYFCNNFDMIYTVFESIVALNLYNNNETCETQNDDCQNAVLLEGPWEKAEPGHDGEAQGLRLSPRF